MMLHFMGRSYDKSTVPHAACRIIRAPGRGGAAIAANVSARAGRAAAGSYLECKAKHSIGEASAITASVVANSDGSSGVGWCGSAF